MSDQMVVIVTGANRGIGLAICEAVLQVKQPVKLYAASRAGADLGLKANGSSSSVHYPKLDVTKQQSIDALAQEVKKNDGQIDLLINNAGVNTHPEHTPKSVKQTLDVNYRGTEKMCLVFLPLLSKHGRVVNMSSVASGLKIYSKDVQSRFRNSNMTLDDIEQIAREYEGVVKEGKEDATGFGGEGQSYCVSKACVNALTATLARENPGLTINCCCPGWVATDMGGIMGKPPKTPADGAKIPVKLGLGDIGSVTGRYWANPGISDRGDGEVQAW